jgi:putative tryptophan/tyrosine transport system substrate-binding protein
MTRWHFIVGMVGVTLMPLTAGAQQARTPLVGFLNTQSPDAFATYASAFRDGLKEGGYSEGQNVRIEYRWARGRNDTLPALAAELAALRPAVIVSTGGEPAATAVKAATSTTPVVFLLGGDPVKMGLVQSFNRPGGNLTGMTQLTLALDAKRLGFLRELVPGSRKVALLMNPKFPGSADRQQQVLAQAQAIGLELSVLHATTEAEIESAVAGLDRAQIGAVLIGGDPFFNSRRTQVIAFVARKGIPAIYEWREFAVAGGLMSYGTHLPDAYRQAGLYAARILKGEKPADMPVLQPTKFQFIINLRTAREQNVAIPPAVLALADEVIE